VLTTKQIKITAGTPQIPVGVDGESIMMSTPVICTTSPGALRVWVPRDRPGVPAPKPPVNWTRLRHLAGIGRERPQGRHESHQQVARIGRWRTACHLRCGRNNDIRSIDTRPRCSPGC